MTWPLLDVIDCSLDEPWCATLAKHLGHFDIDADEAELRKGRRYAVARRLAGLFASYVRQRPELLVDWIEGKPGDLDADLAWQPELWRALVAAIPADPPHIRHQKTVARLREGPADLPSRLSLFGHTRLACTDVRTARRAGHPPRTAPVAAAPQRRAVAGARRQARRDRPPRRHQPPRGEPSPAGDPRARPARACNAACPPIWQTDEYLPGAQRPDTLLGWLQSDIAANVVRPQGRTLRGR